MVQPANVHATGVILGDKGLMITGRSGAGKTTLALALLAEAERKGRFGRLVADDQLFVSTCGGRLLMETPAAIRGLVEVPGLGPSAAATEDRAVVDLVVNLLEPQAVPRFQEGTTQSVCDVPLPSIALAERYAAGAVFVICDQLGF
jgi:serine kinase of HPr protein (carbohydrate metabolism regulator)